MKCYVTFCLQACFIDLSLRLKHRLSDYMSHEMSCLFHAKTSRVIDDHTHSRFALLFELICLYSNLSRHIEERQNGIYCLNFLKQIDRIWKIGLCFLSKATIQWSFTPALIKTMLLCIRVPLHPYILVIKTSAWCVFNTIFYVDYMDLFLTFAPHFPVTLASCAVF